MTLVGVGNGAGYLAGNTTTLGRIGAGYMYADWKSQIAYSSPNWNGFSFTVGVTQAWNVLGDGTTSASSTGRGGSEPALEGKVSYAWAGDVGGKVWASGITQKVSGLTGAGIVGTKDDRAEALDIGANVMAGFGLTGYYGQCKGTGTVVQLNDGFDAAGNPVLASVVCVKRFTLHSSNGVQINNNFHTLCELCLSSIRLAWSQLKNQVKL